MRGMPSGVAWGLVASIALAGTARAGVEQNTDGHVKVEIEAPESVAKGEAFEVRVRGEIAGGNSWSIHMFNLFENGVRIDGTDFGWGSPFTETYKIRHDDAGDHEYTFEFADRGFGHGWQPPVEVRILVTVGGGAPTIEDASDAVQDMLDGAQGGITSPGIASSYQAKLDEALAALDAGDAPLAVEILHALVKQINAQRGKKITEEAADELLTLIEEIIAGIEGA